MPEPTAPAPSPQTKQEEIHSVVKSAGVIGVATFSSRILGFARDMVLARYFGASGENFENSVTVHPEHRFTYTMDVQREPRKPRRG